MMGIAPADTHLCELQRILTRTLSTHNYGFGGTPSNSGTRAVGG